VKKVFVARDVTEAHFVRGLIESQDIQVTVRGESSAGASAEVPFVDAWPAVCVLDDDCEERARAIVKEYEAGAGGTAGAAWRCHKCGQDVEAQFTACWSCGAERER
jgi:hypothetical protein